MSFAATEARFHAKIANKYLALRCAGMAQARAAKAAGAVRDVAQLVRAARFHNQQAVASRVKRAEYRAKMGV